MDGSVPLRSSRTEPEAWHSFVITAWALEFCFLGLNPDSTTSCVALGKPLNLTPPQFSPP